MNVIDFDTWDETYSPQPNHLVDETNLYETYGDEHAYILRMAELAPRRVWTMIETDWTTEIVNGYHTVNRVGFFVTDKEGDANTTVTVSRETV